MPSLKVAHIKEQGQNMIIVPINADFEQKQSDQQQAARRQIQVAARSAGLGGEVVVVWEDAASRMKFLAPAPWHRFLQTINLQWVRSNLNRELSW